MLKIKIRKISHTSKKRYNYRIVVADSRKPRDGKFIEQVGYYDPSKNPMELRLKKERFDYWVSKGAQPTTTVASLRKKIDKIKTT